MDKDLYVCVRDYQFGEFGYYRAQTIEEWRETALYWADENKEICNQLKQLPRKYVIDYISNVWQIELKKINKDEIVKYFVENGAIYRDYSMNVGLILEEIKEKNIKIGENEQENEISLHILKDIADFFDKNRKKIYESCED